MKIALSSYSAQGAWFILRLMAEGHHVDYYLSKADYADVMGGLVPTPKLLALDHRRTIQGFGYPSYKGYDLSLFDLTGKALQAEHSRSQVPTIGDGGFHCIIEDNREAGIQAMEYCGINVPSYQRFNKASEAKSFVKKEDKRYVFKPFSPSGGTQDTATTYVSKDAEDLIKNLDNLCAASKGCPFILQEYVKGLEVSVEAWFNGQDFFFIKGDLEQKKFMNDDLGPNTGCSGNLVFAMHSDMHLFKEGLGKTAKLLQENAFRGPIDLNCIVTEGEIFGLEWTPRFGYLCCPVFANMYGSGFGEMLLAIASGRTPNVKWAASFGAAVTLSIPPYPTEIRYSKAKDVPVEGIDPRNIEELLSVFLYDVCLVGKDKLVTSGNYGYIAAPIGVGDSIVEAFMRCNSIIERIQIPNMQYRTDIEKLTTEHYNWLLEHSWFS